MIWSLKTDISCRIHFCGRPEMFCFAPMKLYCLFGLLFPDDYAHWPLFQQISFISIITLFSQLCLFTYSSSLAHVFQMMLHKWQMVTSGGKYMD